MPKPKLRIGVDLGGTKIEALAMGSDGKELVRQRVLTPQAYDASVEAIAKLVTDVENKAGRTGTVGRAEAAREAQTTWQGEVSAEVRLTYG